jgi:Mrp family chromosome partitioning ATPase
LESFLARYREAAARTDAGYLPADARIISRAVPPNAPSFPKKTMMSVAAAVVMLLLASAVVLLGEFMSGRAFRVIGYGVEGARAESRELSARTVVDAAPEDEVRVVATEIAPAAPRRDEDFSYADTLYDDEPEDEALADEDLLAEVPPIEPAIDEVRAPDPVEHPPKEPHRSDRAPAADPVGYTPPPPPPAPAPIMAEEAPPKAPEPGPVPPAEGDAKSGTAGLAEILANSSVRIALFAGAEGGEGAGSIAFSAARQAAKQKVRSILVDIGREPSKALGNERPGLVDLLSGDASFGEVIQRDDAARVHMIPLGSTGDDIPMQRMQLVIGALTHTYDKVVVVADRLDDWPDELIRPDIAAIVCGPDTSESLRTALYDFTLARGAHSAIIVRYSSDFDLGDREESAAA